MLLDSMHGSMQGKITRIYFIVIMSMIDLPDIIICMSMRAADFIAMVYNQKPNKATQES